MCGRGVVWGPHRGHHYWPAQVLHQAGGECVVQWYGDHRVDTVKHSVLSTFPIVPPRVPTRRSVRGRAALDKAIAEAMQDNAISHQQCEVPQPVALEGMPADSPTTVVVAVNGPLIGLGSGPVRRMLNKPAKPPSEPQHLNIPHMNQVTARENKTAIGGGAKCLPASLGVLDGQQLLPPQAVQSLSPHTTGPTRARRRRRIR